MHNSRSPIAEQHGSSDRPAPTRGASTASSADDDELSLDALDQVVGGLGRALGTYDAPLNTGGLFAWQRDQ